MTTTPMTTSTQESQVCPGANVIASTKDAPIPPCAGLDALLARNEPLAVVSLAQNAGFSKRAYDAIDAAAHAAGRDVLIVRPKARVTGADTADWRATLHPRRVEALADARPLRTLCDTGVVAICGVDSAYCVDNSGVWISNVAADSLLAAVGAAVATSATVCSTSCPAFRPCEVTTIE